MAHVSQTFLHAESSVLMINVRAIEPDRLQKGQESTHTTFYIIAP